MGADQVGNLAKGPVKIPAGRLKKAVRPCLKLRRALLASAGECASRSARQDAALLATGERFDPEDIPDNPEGEIPEVRGLVA
jgi:hypothetical protein